MCTGAFLKNSEMTKMQVLWASVLKYLVALGGAYEVWAQVEQRFLHLFAALVPQVLLLLPSTEGAVMDLRA